MSGRVLLLILASVIAADSTDEQTQLLVDEASHSVMLKTAIEEDTTEKSAYDSKLSALATMPLQHRWIFWRASSEGIKKGQSSASFIQGLAKMSPFSTYGEFMNRWDYLINSDLPHFSSVYLFKDTILPIWEDAKNLHGGKLLVNFGQGYENDKRAIEVFASIIIAMISGKLVSDSEICGASLAFRPWGAAISVWTRKASKRNLIKALKTKISKLVSIPSSSFAYKPHRVSMNVNKNGLKLPNNQSWRRNNTPPAKSRAVENWFVGSASANASKHVVADVQQGMIEDLQPKTLGIVQEFIIDQMDLETYQSSHSEDDNENSGAEEVDSHSAEDQEERGEESGLDSGSDAECGVESDDCISVEPEVETVSNNKKEICHQDPFQESQRSTVDYLKSSVVRFCFPVLAAGAVAFTYANYF